MSKFKRNALSYGLWAMGFFFLILGAVIFLSCKKEQHTAQRSEQKVKKYYCPMHPNYTSDKPGDCPICNMKLVPMGDDTAVKEHRNQSGEETSAFGTISISPERIQLIGVKSEPVSYQNLKKVIRTFANVAYDTELYNAIVEYNEAVKAKEKVKESPWSEVKERADSLIQSSRLRLRQIGLSDSQIEKLNEAFPEPQNLLLGKGSVWVYAQVYEQEAALIRPEQMIEITSPALPGKKFFGTVKSIDPILDVQTRSLKVRALVPNPDGVLRPEMYVDAKIFVALGKKLAVPESAVMNTGKRQLVFLEKEKGKFEPREVQTGQEAEGYVEILSGVKVGEKVVTSANFLLDSESKLKSAISGMEHKH